MSSPNNDNMRNFNCQAQLQHQLQQSPISNWAELGPAQPQLVSYLFHRIKECFWGIYIIWIVSYTIPLYFSLQMFKFNFEMIYSFYETFFPLTDDMNGFEDNFSWTSNTLSWLINQASLFFRPKNVPSLDDSWVHPVPAVRLFVTFEDLQENRQLRLNCRTRKVGLRQQIQQWDIFFYFENS